MKTKLIKTRLPILLLQILNSHKSPANIIIDIVNAKIIIRSGVDVSGMKGKFNKSLFIYLLKDQIFSTICFLAVRNISTENHFKNVLRYF